MVDVEEVPPPHPEDTPPNSSDESIDDLLAKARLDADTNPPETPPQLGRRTRKKTAPSSGGRSKRSLVPELTDMYTTIGMGLMLVNPADAMVVVENAEKMATSLNAWGNTNSNVRRALERLCTTSAFGGVLAAHAPVALAIAANHGLSVTTLLGKKKDGKNSDDQTSEYSANGTAPFGPEDSGSGLAQTSGLAPVIVGAR